MPLGPRMSATKRPTGTSVSSPIAAEILLQRRVEGALPQGADALPGPVPGEGRLAGGGKTRRVHQSSWNSRAKLS